MTYHAEGWRIRSGYSPRKSPWLWTNVHCTRREAIAAYNATWNDHDAYRKHRRKGWVLAVRVKLTEK